MSNRRKQGKVVKEGFLTKSPPQERALAQWHKRFFVLWSTKLMEYYTTSEKKPTDYCKTIDLSKCEDMLAPIPTNNRMHVIKLMIRKSDDRVREYLFDCESETEMNCWVTFLAQVCGFSAVEEDPLSDHTHPTPHPSSARATKPLPPQPSQENRRFNKPPPLPPFKPPVDQGMNYEVPWDMLHQREEDCMEDVPQGVYESVGVVDVAAMNKNPPPVWKRDSATPPPHSPLKRWTLERKPSKSRGDLLKSTPAQLPTMNKDLLIKRPLPPEPKSSQKNLDSFKTKNTADNREESGFVGRYDRDDRNPQRRAQKPLPPPVKSKPTATAHVGVGMGFNIRNDPKFSQKLQERKQIHGGTDAVNVRHSPVMGGEEEDVPQAGYEEILFTASEESESRNTHVHKPATKPTTKATARLRTPSPVMMIENEEGYVDARQAQDYLTFESSSEQRRSRSPVDIPWEQLGPGRPPLQPRTASMMRDSRGTQNGEGLGEPPANGPPLPSRGPTSKPKLRKALPIPPGSMKKEHSPNPSHPRPKSHTVARVSSQSPEPVDSMSRGGSTPTSPPPLPSRDPIRPAASVPGTLPNPSIPKRYPAPRNFTQSQSADPELKTQQKLNRPPSPPPKRNSDIFETLTFGTQPADHTSSSNIQPQPSFHRRVPVREQDQHEDSPPPIPRRHPMASGKHTPDITAISTKRQNSLPSSSPENVDKNALPLPPRGHSPLEDGRPSCSSPPVPPRVSIEPPVPQRLLTQSNRHATGDGSCSPPPPVPNRSSSDSGVAQSNLVESHKLPLAKQGHDPNSASPERHMTSNSHKTKPLPPPKPLKKPPPAVMPRPKNLRNGHSVSDNTHVGIVKKPKPLPPPKFR